MVFENNTNYQKTPGNARRDGQKHTNKMVPWNSGPKLRKASKENRERILNTYSTANKEGPVSTL